MEEKILLEAIGNNIKELRKQKGFSQQNFALEAGLGIAYYGRIERGIHNLTAVNIIRIALTLEVEVGDLFPSKKALQALMKKHHIKDLKARHENS